MRITLLAALSTALLVVPATAQPTQSGSAATTAAQSSKLADNGEADSDKKVCKRLKTSGTRMAKRACLTEDQWKKVEEEAK
jgi:hypothetical protein